MLWAQEHAEWDRIQSRSFVLSDESRVYIDHADCRVRVWRRSGERYQADCVRKHDRWDGASLMVWVAISYNDRIVPVFSHNRRAINAQTYLQDVLQADVVPCTAMHRNIVFNKTTQELAQPDTLNSFLSKVTPKFCHGQHFRRTLIKSNICGITCRGGWTIKTIDLKTLMILNIPYEGTGMLCQDIFYRL
ncbi:transposable element Tcb1 transposase [Elysia marginata]|uniref:Transposable element Tcb1 transposase n=1 Tax=Elysia marginata TaxID=1093978 RepID=A0AAV4IFZ3_9GAST|nr:transposable element Tcb1 transposase [Elysia marginata]